MSLQQLKKIRSQRVERIYSELQQVKAIYAQSENELKQARITFEEYGVWRIAQEKLLFDHLQSDYFSPNQMKDYNLTLEKQKEKESQLEDEIPSFISHLETAEKELEKVRRKLQLATKGMEKVDEFIDYEEKEEAAIEEKQEEDLADELSCFKIASSK